MTSVGVVEHRRFFLPLELKLCRKQLFSSWFYFSGSHMLVSYQAKQRKKPIIVLSSLHKSPETFDDEKKLPCVIHDYNQKKSGVDAVDQCIEYYTVRRISRRWPMIVFYNMIDIAAVNAMTIWLYQNPGWNMRKRSIRRSFLTELSMKLTSLQTERRSKESYLKPKVKIALLSLGYEVGSKSLQPIEVNTCLNRKKRCYLCPSQPGRKVRQTCNNCGRNVCLSHSHNSTMVICQQCDEMK